MDPGFFEEREQGVSKRAKEKQHLPHPLPLFLSLTPFAHLPRVHRQRHDPASPVLPEAPGAVAELFDGRRRRNRIAAAGRRGRRLVAVRDPGLPHLLRARAAPGLGLVPIIPKFQIAASSRRPAVAALVATPVISFAAALLLAFLAALARICGEGPLECLTSEIDVSIFFFN